MKYLVYIIIGLLLSIISYYIYNDFETKKNQVHLILQQDSIRFELLNNKINKIDSVNNVLYKQDSIQNIKINALKKTYKKRKEDITTNRNTLSPLPNF